MRLSADGAVLRLGGRTILDGAGLVAESGEFVGLVGPNGAGKTSLLRLLAGLVAADAGHVAIDGRPLAEVSRDERARRMAVLFPGTGVGWSMSVREIVALGRLPHRRSFAPERAADRDAIARAMRATGVADLAERSEPTLSSGERMRVLLARAFCVEAEMLLADEPITALDPGHQIEAMELLRAASREGAGVIAVLHDLSLAARYCDRLVVLDAGRVVADGRPGEALGDDLLHRVFGITAERGTHADGSAYILPWSRSAQPSGETRP